MFFILPRGIDVASHTGTRVGASSVTLWTPGKGFGVTVLSTVMTEGVAVCTMIALRALEMHAGLSITDWDEWSVSLCEILHY